MDLILKDSISSTEYKTIIGDGQFSILRKKITESSFFTCQCCGWEGAKEIENRNHLTIQVEEYNTSIPTDSKISCICKSCYLINHISLAIKSNFVQLVNSIYSQNDLLKISWSDCSKKTITNNNREKAINDGKIIILKKDPNFYLSRLDNDKKNDKLKIILTDKFLVS